MNPDSGELRQLLRGERAPHGFDPLPAELQLAARMKMARDEAQGVAPSMVNLRSATPLAKWAKQKRKAKLAAQSRRRNRR